jgi:hypothetical protein
LQNFNKTNPIWPYPFQSNKSNHTHDHKAITKLKISETHQETTKSTQLCKNPTQINNQSRKIISNFKSDPQSIKIPSSNLELASILKSNPKPMTLSQITNTKILSLNTSKLKQFLSLKMSIEQIFTMEKSQRTKFQKKLKKLKKISKNKKFFTMRISKNANNKKSSWKNFLMDKSS